MNELREKWNKKVKEDFYHSITESDSGHISHEVWEHPDILADWWLKEFSTLLSDLQKEIGGALLRKARLTDYADRTEYDEAAEIISQLISEYQKKI